MKEKKVKNIYIGYDFDGKPMSVILAEHRRDADIAWAGMGESPCTVEKIDPASETCSIHGVVFLFSSKERVIRESFGNETRYREWKRGV